MDRHFPDIEFKHNFFRVTVFRVTPGAQGKCCSQRGMAGERQLFLHSEDAHANALLAFGGGVASQDERGLGEVHLLGDQLHLGIGYAAGVGEYGQRIALERTRRENIPLRHCQAPYWLAHESSPGTNRARLTLGAALRRHPVKQRLKERWSAYAASSFWRLEAVADATPLPRNFTSSEFTSSAWVQVMQCGPSFTTTRRAPLIRLAVRSPEAAIGRM